MATGFAWWNIAIIGVVVVLAIAIPIVIIRVRSAAVPGTAAARATRVIAVIYVVASGIGTIAIVARTLFDRSVSVLLPVESFWPTIPAGVEIDGLQAEVVGGGFTEALVDVTGLDGPTRVWLAASSLLQGATMVMIAIVIALLCTSVMRQDPFRAALPRAINVTAITIIAGGLAWQLCGAIGNGLASEQVLRSTGGSIEFDQFAYEDYNEIIGFPSIGHQWSVDFWPIWIGLALFALAAAFRYGMKLQRDTEGLV